MPPQAERLWLFHGQLFNQVLFCVFFKHVLDAEILGIPADRARLASLIGELEALPGISVATPEVYHLKLRCERLLNTTEQYSLGSKVAALLRTYFEWQNEPVLIYVATLEKLHRIRQTENANWTLT